ncbi:MAG TPA: primosomal protein N', partial [Candidatus Polarisedimenticolia bacterium]|nr:primosomal protein N' [Candidatus Polarisedimenticolia bacterium]
SALAGSAEALLRRLGVPRPALARLEAEGLVAVESRLPAPKVGGRQATLVHLAGGSLDEALGRCARAPRQRAILELLAAAGREGVPLDEVIDRIGPAGQAVKALAGKGLIRLSRRERRRAPLVLAPLAGQERPKEPTGDQASALARIRAAMAGGSGQGFLLMGVTGSGKTEVYLAAIEACLAGGRSALYLVPEITLTPLLARQLRARLGPSLAILHSSLSPGERFDEWRRALRGEARVVLGARSAVLAPLAGVGLIVVDEEQEGSYKQGEDPRYNGRDLALARGRFSGAVVVAGSATPSIESYHAALSGRLELLRLPSRIQSRPLARVRIVDMRQEFARRGREDLLSGPLREALAERLARREQAIILLNRRGYAPSVLCRSCGGQETCLRCSVALTWHRSASRLRCHYCGYQRGMPKACSSCGSESLALVGSGTERLEESVRDLFPQVRLARLDRDTARGRRAPAEILSAFERGEFDLLVGTQMVAKGHDFPGVTLVGVIAADVSLGFPDFRAAERTFQLLTQVAGRSGRGEEPGEVIVQAYHQDHYAIQAAAAQDYTLFFEKESRYRRIMKYPPFTALASMLVQAGSPDEGVRRARLVGEAARAAGGGRLTVLGPAVAPIARLKGRYRYQVLVKCASRRALSDAMNEAAAALAARGLGSARDLAIDIDPITLL